MINRNMNSNNIEGKSFMPRCLYKIVCKQKLSGSNLLEELNRQLGGKRLSGLPALGRDSFSHTTILRLRTEIEVCLQIFFEKNQIFSQKDTVALITLDKMDEEGRIPAKIQFSPGDIVPTPDIAKFIIDGALANAVYRRRPLYQPLALMSNSPLPERSSSSPSVDEKVRQLDASIHYWVKLVEGRIGKLHRYLGPPPELRDPFFDAGIIHDWFDELLAQQEKDPSLFERSSLWLAESPRLRGLIQTFDTLCSTYRQARREALQKERAFFSEPVGLRVKERSGFPPSSPGFSHLPPLQKSALYARVTPLPEGSPTRDRPQIPIETHFSVLRVAAAPRPR